MKDGDAGSYRILKEKCSGKKTGFEFEWRNIGKVDSFKYLGSTVSNNRGVVKDVIGRVNEGAKV